MFPDATDERFADGYAQAVTFGLLMARAKEIKLATGLHGVAEELSQSSTLIGNALQLLTDNVDTQRTLKTAPATLTRVLDEVDWHKISKGDSHAWLYSYEDFLAVYDNKLRKQTGSYYTPPEVVQAMVSLAHEVLQSSRFGLYQGLAAPDLLPDFGPNHNMSSGVFDRFGKRRALPESKSHGRANLCSLPRSRRWSDLPCKIRPKYSFSLAGAVTAMPPGTFRSQMRSRNCVTMLASGLFRTGVEHTTDTSNGQYGNMTCMLGGSGYCPQVTFSSSTNQVSKVGSLNASYDAAGNMTSDGTHTYQWDAEDRMVSIDGGSTATQKYNALGQRVERFLPNAFGSWTFDYLFSAVGEELGLYSAGTAAWFDQNVPMGGRVLVMYGSPSRSCSGITWSGGWYGLFLWRSSRVAEYFLRLASYSAMSPRSRGTATSGAEGAHFLTVTESCPGAPVKRGGGGQTKL